MSQNRTPPAYQEYAATLLASHAFRLATLEARGLWWTMRLECWANKRLPSDPEELAAILPGAFDVAAVSRALPSLVQSGAFQEDEPGWLYCRELENYRVHLEERRLRQVEGGKTGAALTNASRSSKATGKPRASRRATVGSLVKPNQEQSRQEQKSSNQGEDLSVDAWIADYEDSGG